MAGPARRRVNGRAGPGRLTDTGEPCVTARSPVWQRFCHITRGGGDRLPPPPPSGEPGCEGSFSRPEGRLTSARSPPSPPLGLCSREAAPRLPADACCLTKENRNGCLLPRTPFPPSGAVVVEEPGFGLEEPLVRGGGLPREAYTVPLFSRRDGTYPVL